MSILLLDASGTVRNCVYASLESQKLGPLYTARSIAELIGNLSGASAVMLDLAEDLGFDACRRVRALNPRVPLIVLFDEESAKHLEAALAAGATDCISRPVNPLELCARLRSAARRRHEANKPAGASPPLSPLASEQCFSENLDRAWRRARCSSLPLSLLVVNVDHLASYNHHCGRAAGDDCLHRIAVALREAVFRPDDLVAGRAGGEFLVLLPATDRSGAAVVAERLRARVLDLAIPHLGSPGWQQLTISLGVATAMPAADPSHEDLVAASECALSRAKLDGRNRLALQEILPLGALA
jgi:diguanylate cyclase (GGDEF)-like protein